MTKKQKTKRTQVKDLPATEQELTQTEQAKIQGGKTFFESRSNTTRTASPLATATTVKGSKSNSDN